MTGAFEIVVIAVAAVGVLGALAALLSNRRTWEAYGRDHLLKDSDPRGDRPAPAAPASTPAARAERDDEVRQMLHARNARHRRRGEAEIDVEAELRRLTGTAAPAPGIDEQLRGEIRELVIARNHRRARRGQPPLDVDAELAREIERLTGG